MRGKHRQGTLYRDKGNCDLCFLEMSKKIFSEIKFYYFKKFTCSSSNYNKKII